MSFPQPISKALETVGGQVLKRFVSDDIPRYTGAKVPVADTNQLLSQQIVEPGGKFHPALNHSHVPYGITISPVNNYTGTSTISSGGKLTFDIKSTKIIPEAVYLEVDFLNTSANAGTLLALIAMFSKIQTSFNNSRGSSIDHVGLFEYVNNCMKASDRELTVLGAKENVDPTTYNGNSVSAGASVSYRTRVPGIWDYVQFPLSCVDYLNLDFTFLPNIITAGTALTSEISITAARIVIVPRLVSNMEYSVIENSFRSGVTVKYFELQTEEKVQTLDASTPYHFNLSSIQGLTPQLNVAIRSATHSGTTATTFYDYVSTIRMLDEQGQNSLGPNLMPANYLNTHQVIDHGIDSDFQVSSGHVFYPILYSDGGYYAVEKNKGKMTGYHPLLRNQFDIVTNSTVVGASYTVTFWCYRLMTVTFKPAPPGGFCQVEFNRI